MASQKDWVDPEALQQLREVKRLADTASQSIASAFAKGVIEGRNFSDILRTVGQDLQKLALNTAAGQLQSALSGLLGQGVDTLFALTGAPPSGDVVAFADGGVVNAPTWFPHPAGLGVAGEAGPEAILPLARGTDGKLGVRSGGRSTPVSVVVNVTTPDADSFRRSEAQVSAAVARAVARGQRAL